MNIRAFWKYYLDINLYNAIFSLIFSLTSGIYWGLIIFCSIGIFVGALGFKYFKNNEYYMYYNLGVTKFKLLKNIWLLNIAISIPIAFILSLIIKI